MLTQLIERAEKDQAMLDRLIAVATEFPALEGCEVSYSLNIKSATIHIDVSTMKDWKRIRRVLGNLITGKNVFTTQHGFWASKNWWYDTSHDDIDVCFSFDAHKECLIKVSEHTVPVFEVRCRERRLP